MEKLRAVAKQADSLYKLAIRALDIATNGLNAKKADDWDGRTVNRLKRELDPMRQELVAQLRMPRYFFKQVDWLQSRFRDAALVDVPGLVKLVDRREIEANEWSLTPGRYVGVAPPEVDEEFDFEEALRNVHDELEELNTEAIELAETIKSNFEELGV